MASQLRAYQPPRPTSPLSSARPRRNHLRALTPTPAAPPAPVLVTHSFALPCGNLALLGDLALPPQATGLVLYAHGTSSCRRSSRSRHITRLLQQADLGTFSIDVLALPEMQQSRYAPPAEALLTQRVAHVATWLQRQPGLLGLRLGLLGEGSLAAALLATCPLLGSLAGAVVTLGEYDVAATSAASVPTLLLVGDGGAASSQADAQVQQQLGSHSQVRPVAGASCTFQEPGTLAEATKQAATWFNRHLAKPRPF